MTHRQTLPDLLARVSEDLTEARLNAASRAVREERERADRFRDEAHAYRELLEDVVESLELLTPVPMAHSSRRSLEGLDGWHTLAPGTWPTCSPTDYVDADRGEQKAARDVRADRMTWEGVTRWRLTKRRDTGGGDS